MAAFDIGYIPEGWKRGDELRLIKPPAHLKHGRYALQHFEMGSPDDPPPEIGALTFLEEDKPRVQAWLEWWQADD